MVHKIATEVLRGRAAFFRSRSGRCAAGSSAAFLSNAHYFLAVRRVRRRARARRRTVL